MSKKKEGFISNFSVTFLLVALNVLLYFFVFIVQIFNENFYYYFALNPSNVINGIYVWTIFTHMFLHAGFLHLFVNMFALFSLGNFCERIIGRKRFLWFYLISGVFAGVLSVLLSVYFGLSDFGRAVFGSPDLFMVGASGAIFGIAGLFVLLLPKIRFSIIFFPFFSLPAFVMIPSILFLTWIVTAFTDLPIGNVAHFGGFLSGVLYGLYLRIKYKRKIEILQRHFR